MNHLTPPNQFPFYLVTDFDWQYDFVPDLAAWRFKRHWKNRLFHLYVPIRTSFIPDDSREIKLHVFSFNENDFGYNEFPELDIRREWTNSQKMEALRDYLKEAFK